jgi:CIC family chloride channel protein
VLVCELAGGYDLLVTLMLAEGIALVAPRKKSLCRAHLSTQRESPVHNMPSLTLLRHVRVAQMIFYLDATTKSPPPVPS